MPNKPVHYHEGQFPPKHIDWERLIPLLGPASAALARYDGVLTAVPNAAVLLSPLMTREAVLSSRIEGTQATVTEVLEYEAGVQAKGIDAHKTADIQEVQNYRRAMGEAVDLLEQLPLCMRVLNAAHAVLMDGVRGQGKSPGAFRKIPNWIGPPGCSVDEARFVPISPEKLPDAMKGWETYIHEQTPDRLVQLALLHAEFEALHPFLDGNGRLGRMFVPLFLFSIGLLQSPMFYISAYLEARRDEYYEHLLAVSRDNDWTGWCVFFLTALIEQAKENHAKARAIVDLYQTEKERIVELSRSHHAIRALDFFFHRPIFSTSTFIETTGISKTTANRMLAAFQKGGLLSVFRTAEGRKPAVLAFRALLEIAEGADIS